MNVDRVECAYPDVFYSLCPENQQLVGRYLIAMRGIDHLFSLQQQSGFYPEDMTYQEFHKAVAARPALSSPYLLVRRRVGVLTPTSYRELPSFRNAMNETAAVLRSASNFARYNELGQRRLITSHLRPQIEALQGGNFDQNRFDDLVAGVTPEQVVVTGLFDRYMDEKFGLKYAWQGWVMDKDNGTTGTYSQILVDALSKVEPGHLVPGASYRVIAGRAIDYSGLAKLRRWSGQALPSEDELRAEMGTRSYIFTNRLGEQVQDTIIPTIERDFPGVTEIPNWQRRVPHAAGILLTLHEGIGHTLAIQGAPTSLKELSAEVWAQKILLSLSPRVVSPLTKRLAMAVSLAWAKSDIEGFLAESDPQKRVVAQAYAEFAAMMFNYHSDPKEEQRAIEVDEQGRITINNDLTHFQVSANQLVEELEGISAEESTKPGAINNFIKKWTNKPYRFLRGGKVVSGTTSYLTATA